MPMTEPPVVATACGPVRGTVTADGAVAAFKGIPYAAAPVGGNRFRPPVPAPPWQGVRDAAGYGPTAPKAAYAPPFDHVLPEVAVPGDDYLNLNVWTPRPENGAALPVMVFVHGGAFANGSGAEPLYDGSAFARRGVVLVTLNYRLGADGFLHLGPGTPANLGLLDQIAALEWVRDNIAGFGGDPATVTVFGESAGAMSIGTLLAMPRAKGLFRRAVLQSGAAHHTLTPATARRIGEELAALLGVGPEVEAIGSVPLPRLTAAAQQLRAAITADPDPSRWGEAVLNLMPFEPVVDGELIPGRPIEEIARGGGGDVDLLVGCNSDEYRFFLVPTGLVDHIPEAALRRATAAYGLDPERALPVYRAARPGASAGDLLAQVATDWFYRLPALRLAEAHTAHHPGRAHVYEFAWQPPTYGRRLGACHTAELPFVFGHLDALPAVVGPEPPHRLADAMQSAWVAFARTGDPGWPAYDAASRTVMVFDDEPHPVRDPHAERRRLWEGVR